MVLPSKTEGGLTPLTSRRDGRTESAAKFGMDDVEAKRLCTLVSPDFPLLMVRDRHGQRPSPRRRQGALHHAKLKSLEPVICLRCEAKPRDFIDDSVIACRAIV